MGNQNSNEAHAENWHLKEENSKLEEQNKDLQVIYVPEYILDYFQESTKGIRKNGDGVKRCCL